MTSPPAAIVLQARLASRRLPGKALADVAGRSVLEHCLRRLCAAAVGPVILATTTRPEDDSLASLASGLGAGVFRGSAEDVLGRFSRCARERGLGQIIRATADNPGVDQEAPGRVLAALRATNADYVREDGLPHGAGVEGVSREALLRAALLATDAYDREHVTTFMRRRTDLFDCVTLAAPAALSRPDVRVTVDTADDLESIRGLYRAVAAQMPSLEELIAAWDRVSCRSVA